MIIDTSYFFGDLAIPQSNDAATKSNLNFYIQKYETEFLRAFLGNPAILDADITDGKEYLNLEGVQVLWPGLKITIVEPNPDAVPAVAGRYQSPIANYVYWNYVVRQLKTTQAGDSKATSENSIDVAPWDRLCSIWNQMVDWNLELLDFMKANPLAYPTWDAYYRSCNNKPLRKLLSKINPVF